MASRKTNSALDIVARAARAKTSRPTSKKRRGTKTNKVRDAAYYRRQIKSFLDAYHKGEISSEAYISNANHLQAKLDRLTKKPAKKASRKPAKKKASKKKASKTRRR